MVVSYIGILFTAVEIFIVSGRRNNIELTGDPNRETHQSNKGVVIIVITETSDWKFHDLVIFFFRYIEFIKTSSNYFRNFNVMRKTCSVQSFFSGRLS